MGVTPSPGDFQAIYWDLIEAAEALDHVVQGGVVIDRQHPNAERLRQACQAHALAKIGVLVR